MLNNKTLVVTTVNKVNHILKKLECACENEKIKFVIIGDVKSPRDFFLIGADFYNIQQQLKTGFEFAQKCPDNSYSRKNIGYLIAFNTGTSLIIETDDDNYSDKKICFSENIVVKGKVLKNCGWINLYKYFYNENIWPRGFPLDKVKTHVPHLGTLSAEKIECTIQQGIVNENPDADAIFRLLNPTNITSTINEKIILQKGTWTPFNSQNTIWWPKAFPLMYLPSLCPFRMTDIWRSFVAQKILWENDWGISFQNTSMIQQRNKHDLMKDFKNEIKGYLYNKKIVSALESLVLKSGIEYITDNLYICYEKLVSIKILPKNELILVEAWINDLKYLMRQYST